MVILELDENSSGIRFLYAWSHGRLSVRTSVACENCMMNGAKCFIAAPKLNA